MIAWHFHNGKSLRDGTALPAPGRWLEFHGELQACRSGLHACSRLADALHYAPGTFMCQVEVGGCIVPAGDKVVASRRRILAEREASEWLTGCLDALIQKHLPASTDGAVQDWVRRAKETRNRRNHRSKITARLADAMDCLAKAHARAAMPVGFNLSEYFAEEDRQWNWLSQCLEEEAQKFLYETN